MAYVRAHVFVEGEVQGVSFRKTARKVAIELGVAGWIKNLPDGRVEAVFEGWEKQVSKMVQWCCAGPPRATISKIDVQDEAFTGEFAGFTIGQDEVELKACIGLS